MPVICPTVTAYDMEEYRAQLERVQPFAERIHIDLMDGVFAPTKSPDLSDIYLPEGIISDIHLMYQKPMDYLDQLIKIKPNLVIFHQEADVDHAHCAVHLRESGIKAGLAILHDTVIEDALENLKSFDHVLVFSGNLGYHGGEADLGILGKVKVIKQNYPGIEISWDGGINDQNAKQLIEGGVDVLNTGGFIQDSDDPAGRYKQLEQLVA